MDPSALECLTRCAGLWLEIVAARKAGTPAPAADLDRPGSGKMAELLHDCGIDADAIVAAARRLVELGPQIGSAAAAGAR